MAKTFLQGDLECFCGIYSIMNAASHLGLFNKISDHKLYSAIISSLDKDKYLAKAALDGLWPKHIKLMLKVTQKLAESNDLPMETSKPFKKGEAVSIDSYFAHLSERFKENTPKVMIISTHGKTDHWLAVTDATPKQLKVIDSADDISVLNRSSCHTDPDDTKNERFYYLNPNRVFELRLN